MSSILLLRPIFLLPPPPSHYVIMDSASQRMAKKMKITGIATAKAKATAVRDPFHNIKSGSSHGRVIVLNIALGSLLSLSCTYSFDVNINLSLFV